MLFLLIVAFLSGAATVASPCILPVLPIVLASAVRGNRWRPIGVMVGLVVSFSLATIFLASVVTALHVPADLLRTIGIIIVAVVGISLLIPSVLMRLESVLGRVGQLGAGVQNGQPRDGFRGGVVLGAGLGLVWTPCAGPILASVIVLAATNGATTSTAGIVVAYAVGAAVPMLAIAYGGQFIVQRVRRFARHSGAIQRAFGALMIVTALAMVANVDRTFQVWAVSALPAGWSTPLASLETSAPIHLQLTQLRAPGGSGSGVAAAASVPAPTANHQAALNNAAADASLGLDNLGPAPNFAGILRWYNTPHPLSIAALRGKVVLIDFWTYSCINCLRTLPHVLGWYARYRSMGFVVVGVHSPEFPFEGIPANVAQAIRQLHITYPVAMDNNYATWNAYNNQYWPAEYLIDAHGVIRHTNFGEGDYANTERIIQQLLRDAGRHVSMPLVEAPDLTPTNASITAETYVGSDRISNFASPQQIVPGRVQSFTLPGTLANGQFALAGRWMVNLRTATVMHAGAVLDFSVHASKVFVVLSPRSMNDRVRVLLDGKPVVSGTNAGTDVHGGVVQVHMDNLYNVVDLGTRIESHHLRLIFDTPGTEVYSFTFG